MRETFPIVPAGAGPLWFLAGLTAFLLALVALFAYIAYSSRHLQVEVTTDTLRVEGGLYGKSIPRAALAVDRAAIVDLTRPSPYRPTIRTNGVGLPGFLAGWVRLQDGEKALVFLTDRRHVAYLPTTEGYALLASLEDPEGLLAALRR